MAKNARVVRITVAGGPEVLTLDDAEVAEPGPGQVRVAVAAAGLNRADVLQRRGLYPAPPGAPAEVPGLEYSGVVDAIGDGVRRWSPGDRVMGIVGGGGMATHLLAHEREILPVPEHLDLEKAAAIPEVYLTAFDALFVRAAARMGEWVLIHAAASGVGTAARQLADVAGLRCIGTTRSAAKLDPLRELGLAHVIHTQDGTFADEVAAVTGSRGADVILDFVGASYLAENLKAAASLGRLVLIGLMGGARGQIPLGLVLSKRLTIVGTTLRSRPLEQKAALVQRFEREALPHFAAGRLDPVIDSVLPMTEIARAHERMEKNDTVGKIVLTWKGA